MASVLGVWGGNLYGKYRISKNRKIVAPLILDRMQNVTEGDKVPDFMLENLAFEPVKLSEFIKPQKSVLIFMDPTCHSCIEDMKTIESISFDVQDYDRFIFISSGNPRLLKDLNEEFSSKFTMLYDHEGVFSSQFGVSTYPFHLIIDSRMTVLEAVPGKLTEDEIIEIITDQSFGETAGNLKLSNGRR